MESWTERTATSAQFNAPFTSNARCRVPHATIEWDPQTSSVITVFDLNQLLLPAQLYANKSSLVSVLIWQLICIPPRTACIQELSVSKPHAQYSDHKQEGYFWKHISCVPSNCSNTAETMMWAKLDGRKDRLPVSGMAGNRSWLWAGRSCAGREVFSGKQAYFLLVHSEQLVAFDHPSRNLLLATHS